MTTLASKKESYNIVLKIVLSAEEREILVDFLEASVEYATPQEAAIINGITTALDDVVGG